MTFGRSAECDISFPDDSQMSSKHFQLNLDQSSCRLRDLESTNGTRVNDQPAQVAMIDHDDSIQAGNTSFQILVEGHVAKATQSAATAVNQKPESQPAVIQKRPAKIQSPAKLVTTTDLFVLESCPSGALRIGGSIDQIKPTELVQSLSAHLPCSLIVDPHRMQIPVDQIAGGQIIFDWLDPIAAAMMSPLLVPADDSSLAHLEGGWGADAIVCLFHSCDNAQLHELLKSMSRPKNEKDGILGICWPKILAHLLDSQQAISESLLNIADAVLIEDLASANQWGLYGNDGLSDLLNKAGIRHQAAEPALVEETE